VTRCSEIIARKGSSSKRGRVTIRAPARSVELSIIEPKMCAKGTMPAITSPERRPVSGNAAKARSMATNPACVCAALLGSPVVPLELISRAVSRGSRAPAASGSPVGSASSASTVSIPAARAASRARGKQGASAITRRAPVWRRKAPSSRAVSSGLAGARVRPAASAPCIATAKPGPLPATRATTSRGPAPVARSPDAVRTAAAASSP
jgi:hypothetical protein